MRASCNWTLRWLMRDAASTVTAAIPTGYAVSVWPSAHRPEAARTEVAGGARLDRQWDVGVHWVQVLLDHAVDVPVKLGKHCQQFWHVRFSERGLAHNPERDGFGKGELLPPNPLPHFGVDLLEMHVRDPLRKALDDFEIVPVAVGDMAGVEAEVHQIRISVGQEPLNALLGVDVSVGVWVEHELY